MLKLRQVTPFGGSEGGEGDVCGIITRQHVNRCGAASSTCPVELRMCFYILYVVAHWAIVLGRIK